MEPEVPVAPVKVGSLVGLGSGTVERLGLCPQKLGCREVGAQRGCKDAGGVAGADGEEAGEADKGIKVP